MLDAEPELVHDAGPKILQHEVGRLRELEDDIAACGLLEIDRDAALVAVDRDVVRALTLE